MCRASQILPYRDARGRSLPPRQPGGDQLVAVGRKGGNDETSASESSEVDVKLKTGGSLWLVRIRVAWSLLGG